ncbi:stAR-related lipid transfer protein 5-like [Amphiura filiformis]|uniref:stAR-related lipid transfer protein 5-like n=1 Tax=Amphiura filiformis TaxID=82378 RepID=UPI003B21EBE2
MAVAPDYHKVAEDALTTLLEIINDKEGWSKCQNVRKIFISSKKSNLCAGNMFKAELEIDGPMEKVLHYWNPKPKGCRGDWDNSLSSVEGFDIIDDEVMVVRTVTPSAAMGLISSREFIDTVMQRRYPDKNMVVLSSHHVEHKDYPIKPEFVRGRNHPCGITFTAVPGTPEKTQICYLAHTELGGDIPLSLTEAALPSSIHSMFDLLGKKVVESVKNDEDEGSAI